MSNADLLSSSVTGLIAVVDDDQSVRHAILRLLRSIGYPAVAFANAHEFLGSPQFKDTACLILDIQMPGLSGLDLFQVITALQAPMPTIVITGHPDESVRAHAAELKIVGLLEKPFGDQALITLLHKALKTAILPPGAQRSSIP